MYSRLLFDEYLIIFCTSILFGGLSIALFSESGFTVKGFDVYTLSVSSFSFKSGAGRVLGGSVAVIAAGFVLFVFWTGADCAVFCPAAGDAAAPLSGAACAIANCPSIQTKTNAPDILYKCTNLSVFCYTIILQIRVGVMEF